MHIIQALKPCTVLRTHVGTYLRGEWLFIFQVREYAALWLSWEGKGGDCRISEGLRARTRGPRSSGLDGKVQTDASRPDGAERFCADCGIDADGLSTDMYPGGLYSVPEWTHTIVFVELARR